MFYLLYGTLLLVNGAKNVTWTTINGMNKLCWILFGNQNEFIIERNLFSENYNCSDCNNDPFCK